MILRIIQGATLVSGAALTKVNNFGTKPTGAEMYIYLPDRLANNPPILVAIHYCTGTANAMYTGTQYKSYADPYRFIIIYPDAPDSGGCWDQYNADASRVFAVGFSSGAMMTNVLMGAYPDVFAAGSSWASVPFGCFAGSSMWNSQCARGQLIKTAQQWGDQVRNAYLGYTGKRPKIQLWHGTNDDTLYFQNWEEAIKQWINIFGVNATPTATTSNSPVSGWTRYQYGPNVEAIKAQGQPHNLPHQDAEVIKYFNLNTTGGTNPSTSTTSTAPSTTTTPPTTGTVPKWGQCGGIGWTGPTQCVSGSTCTKINDLYTQVSRSQIPILLIQLRKSIAN
ncbi:Alpha/Beta hydrolase protein [Kalaharituber pfeilii]|nr:Alpha/Beta hydrolase protein [Kalaharituber pfeilii]